MIKIHREGRLANQLFQFAFGYAASKILNTRFFIQDAQVPDYFTLPGYTPPKASELLEFHQTPKKLHLDAQLFLHPWFIENVEKAIAINGAMAPYDPAILERPSEVSEPLEILQTQLQDQCLYFGYFQSEQYFLPYREEIHDFLAIKPEIVSEARKLSQELFNRPTVVIHVRRTDFINLGFEKLGHQSLCLPYQYFWDALDSLENREAYNLIFISDDIEDVRREFSSLPHSYFPHHSEIIDFTLMTFADVNIMSNSSYSWWGAYLNKTANRRVITPQHFWGFHIGQDFPEYIRVPEWTEIPVRQSIPY